MVDYSNFKLGRPFFHVDRRTIQFSPLVKTLPAHPAAYDVDSAYPGLIDNHMYKNDTYGDCVIAGRAHHTLRLEDYEQKLVIPISDSDVTTEYFKETGGADTGLDMITSLNCWRKGWVASGHTYDIYAYAQVTVTNKEEVKAAMYMLNGLYIGVNLPISAQTQDIWDADNTPNGTPGGWGGHCIYLVAYDDTYLTCITWGERKKMTWAFLQKYCDQAFAIVDDKDSWCTNDPLDVTALQNILNQITGNNPVPPPAPTDGTVNLQVTPANAVITINGGKVPGEPKTILIAAGKYTIGASLNGYTSAKVNVTVVAGKIQTVILNLKKKTCIFS
jgi:hypothetical protein